MPDIADVIVVLDQAGLKWREHSRYLVAQCPLHDDAKPSCQIFKDDLYVNCLAGCGRFPIQKAFPGLGGGRSVAVRSRTERSPQYKLFNLYDQWRQLPMIPRDFTFKGLPLKVLDDLGWRWLNGEISGMGRGIFIPYWNKTKTAIPFAQTRHLQGDRRFTFLAGAKPMLYGAWNSNNSKIFLVEGTSDGATLDYCMIPWLAMPSAASGEIAKQLGRWCQQQGVSLVYAGDNDKAGEMLQEAVDGVIGYRVCQPPKPYKDWSDFFVGEGQMAVFEYCAKELFL